MKPAGRYAAGELIWAGGTMPGKIKWEWTDEEDRRMLELRAAGKSAISISRVLKRTPRAIEARYYMLRKRMGKNVIKETFGNDST